MSSQQSMKKAELIVSTVLQVGVILSALTILAGTVLLFSNMGNAQSSYRRYVTPNYSFPHTISTLKSALLTGSGTGFIEIGVFLLILTPILRVATSILIFKRQKDTPMTLVTLFVLLVLISSFVLK